MIVVSGATGTVGRPLVALLKDRDVTVRAVTRSTEARALPVGVESVTADLTRRASLAPVLEGARPLCVHPRALGANADNLLALAAQQGVRRVVATNVDDDPAYQPSRLYGDRNKEVEGAVAGSGLPWVAVRANPFATDTILGRPARTFAECVSDHADVFRTVAS
jgi:uncharacterized protein YbjT (DUF2867 family)